jgi:V/A-type H+-transporting ATPase subunit E
MEEAKKIKNEILEQARQNAQERERRMLQMSQLSGRKAILAEKQKAIHSIFSAVLDRLSGLEPNRYRKMLKHMLLKSAKTGREEIILSSKHRKILGRDWLENVNKELVKTRRLPGKLKFSEETRNIIGGFILRDGQVEINSSFEAILKYNQNEMESLVADFFLFKKS